MQLLALLVSCVTAGALVVGLVALPWSVRMRWIQALALLDAPWPDEPTLTPYLFGDEVVLLEVTREPRGARLALAHHRAPQLHVSTLRSGDPVPEHLAVLDAWCHRSTPLLLAEMPGGSLVLSGPELTIPGLHRPGATAPAGSE